MVQWFSKRKGTGHLYALEIADRLYTECLKVREREAGLRDFAISKDFTLETLRKRLLGK